MKRILLALAALLVVAVISVGAWAISEWAPPQKKFTAPVVVDIPARPPAARWRAYSRKPASSAPPRIS
ncbi:MAG: hypothetical protein R2724_30695 [Bryobacterales bacterium]